MPDTPTLKRPTPPPGSLLFGPRHRSMDLGNSVMICPACGAPEGKEKKWGYVWYLTVFTDPGASEFFLKQKERQVAGEVDGYTAMCAVYEGQMLKLHWSRLDGGECSICGCLIWHDWGGSLDGSNWRWYYVPQAGAVQPQGQLPLF